MPKATSESAQPRKALSLPELVGRKALLGLKTWAQVVVRVLARVQIVEWSDTPQGHVVDFIPNPKRYAIVRKAGIVVSVDCGNPGISVSSPD